MDKFDILFRKYVLEGSSRDYIDESIEKPKKIGDNYLRFIVEQMITNMYNNIMLNEAYSPNDVTDRSDKTIKYVLPTDPSQMMNDFYLAQDMRTQLRSRDFTGSTSSSTKLNIPPKFYTSFYLAIDTIVDKLKKELLDAVYFSLAAEFRHITDGIVRNDKDEIVNILVSTEKEREFLLTYINYYQKLYPGHKNTGEWARRPESDEEVDKIHKDDLHGRVASLKALEATKLPRHEIVFIMWKAFDIPDIDKKYTTKAEQEVAKNKKYYQAKKLVWEGGYGGEAWANIAKGWLKLYKSNDQDQTEVVDAIDWVYDLQHNNSTVFQKLARYAKNGGYNWVITALDRKFQARSPWELWYHASPTFKYITAPLLMKSGFGSKESYEKDVEAKYGVTAEELDKLKTRYMKDGSHPKKGPKIVPTQDWSAIWDHYDRLMEPFRIGKNGVNLKKIQSLDATEAKKIYNDIYNHAYVDFMNYLPKDTIKYIKMVGDFIEKQKNMGNHTN